MFIKLTRLDGSPIWLNSVFVVTVEPRKGGGSVVVPVGDGLDYDVKEAPDAVLSALGNPPAPAVLPVPTTDALVQKPVRIVDGPEDAVELPAERSVPPPPKEKKPAEAAVKKATSRKATRRTARAQAVKTVAESSAEQPSAPKAEAQPEVDPMDVFAKAEAPQKAVQGREAGALSDELVQRLRKIGPRSVRTLTNTLATQFHVADPATTTEELAARGILKVEGVRVTWC